MVRQIQRFRPLVAPVTALVALTIALVGTEIGAKNGRSSLRDFLTAKSLLAPLVRDSEAWGHAKLSKPGSLDFGAASVLWEEGAEPSLYPTLTDNQIIRRWVERFSKGELKGSFNASLARGQRYKIMIQSILERHGVPAEFFYLPLVESSFNRGAMSAQSAGGFWQLVPATAKRYGLRVDKRQDDRKDPVRSTNAAARYLRTLYDIFQSWELVLAAYNAGEHRILQALRRSGPEKSDFWSLVDRRGLPAETQAFVPKFLAAVMVGENPDRFSRQASFVTPQDPT